MTGYGQFCPVAKATELIGEKWTVLVLRELLLGTTRIVHPEPSLLPAAAMGVAVDGYYAADVGSVTHGVSSEQEGVR